MVTKIKQSFEDVAADFLTNLNSEESCHLLISGTKYAETKKFITRATVKDAVGVASIIHFKAIREGDTQTMLNLCEMMIAIATSARDQIQKDLAKRRKEN